MSTEGSGAVLERPAAATGVAAEPAVSGPLIVVVDDDYVMRLSCRQILAKQGYAVETFEDGTCGLEAIARLRPGLVVVDLKMPGISGLEVIQRVHALDPEIVVVVITGYATIGTAVDAIKCGAYDFLPKPFTPDELRVIVRRGLQHRQLMQDTRRHELDRELLRRRFVTFISHQLRSPLNAIHQYLDVLQRLGDGPDVEQKRRVWTERCLRRTAEMQSLIRDWLTLAEVQSGSLLQRRDRVELYDIVRGVLQTYEGLAETHGVQLIARAPAPAAVVHGDRNGIVVLIDNLVVNAIKYNRSGGTVTVSVSCRGSDAVIEVADTGIGIAPVDREYVFDEFFRVRRSDAPSISGTGLGLPICKRIVSELGGTIEVESEENVGSTFRVRLPAASVAGDP